jgi:hypothetical protein
MHCTISRPGKIAFFGPGERIIIALFEATKHLPCIEGFRTSKSNQRVDLVTQQTETDTGILENSGKLTHTDYSTHKLQWCPMEKEVTRFDVKAERCERLRLRHNTACHF